MKYLEIAMRWDTFIFPIKKGTPVSAYGVLSNNADAVGIIPTDITEKPIGAKTRVIVGGSVDLDSIESSYGETITNNALTAMDGITFMRGGTRYPNVYKADYTLPVAEASVLGGVKIGSGIAITAQGVISLEEATSEALGGVLKAANVAESEATDVAGCVTSINAILTALKTAGIMVADATE